MTAAANEAVPSASGELPPHLAAYLDAFNRRDWAQLQTLFEDGVQLELVGYRFVKGKKAIADSYLKTFEGLPFGWKLVPCQIDGEVALVCMREKDGVWVPRHPIRLRWHNGRVAGIRDYAHVDYLLKEAELVLSPAAPQRK